MKKTARQSFSTSAPFLNGGGKTGKLIRSINWSNTSLGDPEHWPEPLKLSVSTALSSAFPMAICWSSDLIYFYNDAFLPILGPDQHPAAMGAKVADVYREAWSIVKPMYIKALKGKAVAFSDYLLPINRDGALKNCWFDFSYSPIRDSSGQISGVLVIAIETTSKVESLKELETNSIQYQKINKEMIAANELFQMAIGTADIGTWNVDLHSDIFSVSDRARQMYGMQDQLYMSLDDSLNMVLPEFRELLKQKIQVGLKETGSFQMEFQIQPMDGGPVKWVKSTAKVYRDTEGDPTSVAGTVMNITETKEDELRKNDFIGMVSHELKTPLTSLSAMIQMAEMRTRLTGDELLKNSLTKANSQIRKMNSMINGFLNLSRMESGKIQLNMEVFSLDELVLEMVEEVKSTTNSHYLKLAPCKPLYLMADRDKIGSVITNLITNAIKYSPQDTTIYITCHETEDLVCLSVKDEGMGIASHDLDSVFNRFYRVSNEQTKSVSGFGIGLYLSSEIIERHHGKIWAESQIGKGSEFHFSIPRSIIE